MPDLNRTLRPQSWNQVVGQESVKELCQKTLAEGNFPKFSIFHGPTGTGKSCIAELIAKQLTNYEGDIEHCPNITKHNMASLVGKKDIVEVIDGIFKFKTSGTTVFILEEVQVLKQKEEQAPFLEELTKIPANVYIIMCTTKLSSLLPELRNRAIAFQLTLPTLEECKEYVTNILEELHFAPMSDRAKTVLIKASDFTPRSIVKHIELLSSGSSVNEEDISKFFHVVSNENYIKTLYLLTDPSITLYQCVRSIKQIIEESRNLSFLYGLRDFAIQLLIEKSSGTEEMPLTKQERELCKIKLAAISEPAFIKVFEILTKINEFKVETYQDVLAVCIKIKIALIGKTPMDIIQTNTSQVSEALISNKQLARKKASFLEAGGKQITQITETSNLSILGTEGDCIYEEQH